MAGAGVGPGRAQRVVVQLTANRSQIVLISGMMRG